MPITGNKNYPFSFSMIDIKMIDPSPYQHRKYFDENSLREDLSVIEAIEANIEIIDLEMGEKPEYLTVGKTPLERVIKLLSKFDSIRRSKARGSVILEGEKVLSNKYVGQVESIFKNLPKSLKWQPFLIHDLILLTDIPSIVQTASVKHDLSFFKDLFSLMREHSKPSTRNAFLNADFRDFQGIPAFDEDPENAILLLEYAKLLENCGWKVTHLIDCPLSTERFTGNMVKKNAGKKNPRHYQKNLDHRKTKYTSQIRIINHTLNTKAEAGGKVMLWPGLNRLGVSRTQDTGSSDFLS